MKALPGDSQNIHKRITRISKFHRWVFVSVATKAYHYIEYLRICTDVNFDRISHSEHFPGSFTRNANLIPSVKKDCHQTSLLQQ